jgi:prolyl-tRNA synthetase
VGLGDVTYVTFAAGGAFTKFSHEFQTITDAGEDVIYLHRAKNIAVNEEVMTDDVLKNLGVTREELEPVKSAEVGNIFNFGTSKCDDMGLFVTDETGKQASVYLGSYGIGITRLMGVIVEHFADERGIVWPKAVAPFQIHLVSLCREDEHIKAADELYQTLTKAGVDVLYDDRSDVQAGEKFADSDLIGIPARIVISKKLIDKGVLEYKERTQTTATEETLAAIIARYA